MAKAKIWDALEALYSGREPFLVDAHRRPGWTIEVYRVGRRLEYQGLARGPETLQTDRVGGPGAHLVAMAMAIELIDRTVDELARRYCTEPPAAD